MLDYTMQQQRLLPLLATAYAFQFVLWTALYRHNLLPFARRCLQGHANHSALLLVGRARSGNLGRSEVGRSIAKSETEP